MDKIIKIHEVFEKLNRKAETLQEAMIVMPHKFVVKQELHDLNGEVDEVSKLQAHVTKLMQEHESKVKKEYASTMASIQRNQQKMMLLLQHMESMDSNELQVPTPADEGYMASAESPAPKLSLAEFSVSPLAQKKLKVRLQFSDFEADITNEAFAKIPSYMKGRTTLEEFVEFLDKIILRTFNEKYQIVHQKKSALNSSDAKLQNEFKVQAKQFEGEKFISTEDVARVLERGFKKKEEKLIQMLRHLHIIREARKGSSTFYIWLKN